MILFALTRKCVALRTVSECGVGPGREVFILEDLKDANIVQFLGACFEEGSTMLVTGMGSKVLGYRGSCPSKVPCFCIIFDCHIVL